MSKKKYNEIEPTKKVVVEDKEVQEVSEKKPLEKVVSVQPQKVKRGLLSRLVSAVIGPEGASGIGEYVNDEIIKPAIKNLIVESVTSGINMIVHGDRGGRGGYRGGGNSSRYGYGNQRTDYNQRYAPRYNDPEPRERERERDVRSNSRHRVEEYVIRDRNEAADVLVQLTENAEVYGHVSVADYYDLISVTSVYTDNNYGWTWENITRATLIPVRGGYVIKFPPLEVL